MSKEMIISSNSHETAVAILEDDLVTEVFIERERQRGTVGNIYKGRVSKVLPGMQSAFVDVGLERDAFLYVSEVHDTLEELERFDTSDDGDEKAEDRDLTDSGGETDGDVDGNVNPVASEAGHKADRDRDSTAKIEDLLKQGQEVLVQVVKEPLGTKGARITSHVSMPGRFLVFLPTVDHIGISRKIASREERSRLRRIVREFKSENNFSGGVIVRTAAGGRSEEDILGDLSYFHQVWTGIRQRAESNPPPTVVYQEESLVGKLVRDFLTADYSAIRIDNAEEYGRVVKLVERIMPDLASRVRQYTKSFPIFDEYGIQNEIDKALRPKVWLKSGGYIVINHTEALVAIDVNTGRYVGKRTGRLEDTILKTNLEAVKEIAHQFRLRDLGGIIVLDLIDMEERKNRQKVFQAMEQELRRDRSPSKAIQVVDVGLIIVTRKRVKQTLERQLTEPCPYCSGSGTIKSMSTICYEILAEMQKIRGDLNGHGIVLRVNPDIAQVLEKEERGVLRDLRATLGRDLTLKPDARLHHEQFDVMAM